ncbi:MAG: hypothetical protein ABL953_14750 [Ilumatobacteraceae bacterium]
MLPAWAKVAAPLVVAGSGLTAGGIALLTDDSSATSNAAASAWIDYPLDQASVLEGVVVVQGHGSAGSGLTALTLSVDGVVVATDDTLEFNEGLAYATFEWNAAIGLHDLVVAGGDTTSMIHQVTVVAEAAPTTTTIPSSTSTTSTTTTTIAPEPAQVSSVSASPTNVLVCAENDRRVTITASVQDASSAQLTISIAGVPTYGGPMSISGSTASRTVTLAVNFISPTNYTATVTAEGPGGSDSGSTTFESSCKP